MRRLVGGGGPATKATTRKLLVRIKISNFDPDGCSKLSSSRYLKNKRAGFPSVINARNIKHSTRSGSLYILHDTHGRRLYNLLCGTFSIDAKRKYVKCWTRKNVWAKMCRSQSKIKVRQRKFICRRNDNSGVTPAEISCRYFFFVTRHRDFSKNYLSYPHYSVIPLDDILSSSTVSRTHQPTLLWGDESAVNDSKVNSNKSLTNSL